jgi:hypothetical protein
VHTTNRIHKGLLKSSGQAREGTLQAFPIELIEFGRFMCVHYLFKFKMLITSVQGSLDLQLVCSAHRTRLGLTSYLDQDEFTASTSYLRRCHQSCLG